MCPLAQEQKQRLADAMEKAELEDGQRLFPAFQPPDRCFLLRSGVVRITAADGSLSHQREGACIGMRALVASDNR